MLKNTYPDAAAKYTVPINVSNLPRRLVNLHFFELNEPLPRLSKKWLKIRKQSEWVVSRKQVWKREKADNDKNVIIKDCFRYTMISSVEKQLCPRKIMKKTLFSVNLKKHSQPLIEQKCHFPSQFFIKIKLHFYSSQFQVFCLFLLFLKNTIIRNYNECRISNFFSVLWRRDVKVDILRYWNTPKYLCSSLFR